MIVELTNQSSSPVDPSPLYMAASTVRLMWRSSSRPPDGDIEPGGGLAEVRSSAGAWALGCFVVSYNVTHHNGLFGSAELSSGTRLADWIDLATPFAVLLPLLAFLWCQQPSPRWWAVAAVGSILYVEGHGIHLSANSISNVTLSGDGTQRSVEVIHLWDEVVGHYVWFLGLAIVIAACAATVRGRSVGVPTSALIAGGAACGLTWATNGLEGGTAVASLAASLVAIVPALRRDRGLASGLAAGGATAAIALIVYAIWHSGFPQPSSI